MPPVLCPRSPSPGIASNSRGCATCSSSSGKRQAGHRCRRPSLHPPSLSPPPAPARPHQRPTDARAGLRGPPCASHLHAMPGGHGGRSQHKDRAGRARRTAPQTSEAAKTSFPSSPASQLRAGSCTMASAGRGCYRTPLPLPPGQFRAALSGDCHHRRGGKLIYPEHGEQPPQINPVLVTDPQARTAGS